MQVMQLRPSVEPRMEARCIQIAFPVSAGGEEGPQACTVQQNKRQQHSNVACVGKPNFASSVLQETRDNKAHGRRHTGTREGCKYAWEGCEWEGWPQTRHNPS
eukprot:7611891-Pyramimonas_sp.AAC.1